jgi:hypothetical protein
MGMWLAIGLIIAAITITAFRYFSRKSFKKGRTPQPLSDIYNSINEQVSSEVFNEVWLKVGEALSIDPKLIRPSDSLKTLGIIDSWNFYKGEDSLSLWIEQKHLDPRPQLETMLDLVKWIQQAKSG